ncbi:hypothetical protein C7974DRAFT_447774 [Boeremia exigua]|uniref:uncharacterized protein n=1 Tax=Boeremia exigua TaxID=749465 RepID=UPI001E8EAA63|nr:uncharacterized protein C7974DRAFT_447774 [Boeremia exigua]KAH6642939.1 hypothetical protein C7974DRAFT_447774 [Boeremia exigua]
MAPPKFILNEPIPMRGGPNDTAEPQVIEIQRSTSQPADPDAPSFLTTFPPEVRNAVYEILFKRDQPILVIDPEMQEEYPAWLEDDEYRSGDSSEDESQAELEAAAYMDKKTHDLNHAILLLRVCRQIYHEAVGVLYSDNTFCVTVPEHRHNWITSQISTASGFLQSIGSQFSFITKVVIDVDRCCRETCQESREINLLPLLRVLWARPGSTPQICFDNTGLRIHSMVHHHLDNGGAPKICIPRMNKMLHSFAVADHMGIRRYGRFERSLEGVYIEIIHNQDYPPLDEIIYRSSVRSWGPKRFAISVTRFELSDNGTVRRSSVRKPTLDNTLPCSVLFDIWHYVMTYGTTITFDLHNSTVTGLDHTLLRLNWDARRYAYNNLRKHNQIVLEMETLEKQSSFDNFRKLRDWLGGMYGSILKPFCPHLSGPIDFWPGPTMLLRFNVPDETLAGLRINVLPLIRLTYDLNKYTTVRFTVGALEPAGGTVETYEIQLQNLRRRCFILLSAAMLKATVDRIAPDIWIDGTGAAMEVSWPSSNSGRARRGPGYPATESDLQSLGRDYVERVTQKHERKGFWPWTLNGSVAQRCGELVDRNRLHALWHALRILDWAENA